MLCSSRTKSLFKKITSQNFKPYGWIIEFPSKKSKSKNKNLFRIVLKETHPFGWRIAYLVLRDKKVTKMERHPGSFESFEPVKGKSILYLAQTKNESQINGFYLDKPVILKKNLWHAVKTVTKESEIKITENSSVDCIYWLLKKNIL